ncbi:helix-turn-helix transcriptional regulator [Lachnospiraceae bacterium 38-14]
MEIEKNKKNRYGFDFTPMGLDIKTFREAQKITREKLAETLDITPRHLQAIELEGKHPSLGLLAYIATIFDMPIDPYIFPEKADAKSAVRKRLDVLLDKLNDRDLSILEATTIALYKVKEQTEE